MDTSCFYSVITLGLFDVATDKQNFIKYVSRPEDLRQFILLVAVLYFVFCCLIGTLIFSWDVSLAYREFKGNFDEMVLGRDFELRDCMSTKKKCTILLEGFLCFLLNIYMVCCDSPESVEKPMFHLASWQTLALTSSLVSIVVAFGRLLWLNYQYSTTVES